MNAKPKRPQSVSAEQLSNQPGRQSAMKQQPESDSSKHRGSGKLEGKVAIVTGGDSGIGRAVAIAFAKESADLAVIYLEEDQDAAETARLIEEQGRQCLLLKGDLGDEAFCQAAVGKIVEQYDRLDILVNNAGEQHVQKNLEDITAEQLERTFRTNIFAMFFLTKAALLHLESGAAIINTASVTAYKGHPLLLDYSATKGAIVSFTRSLALSLAQKDIRVNAVAPGPIWTPLIPSTFNKKQVEEFGKNTPLKRPGQPEEVAMAYVSLASDDASYVTGQTIHVNGGSIVNS